MTRRLLVICTANVCRSPVAERLFSQALTGQRDADGIEWTVASAGTGQYSASLDPSTVAAADGAGIDIRGHRSRVLDRDILTRDGADLVLTMTRGHLPAVVALDPGAWTRTFTLKELARRADTEAPPAPDEGFAGWLARMAAGRQARLMMNADPLDDVADPYGMPKRHHVDMVAEVSHEIDRLIKAGPWG